jgi:hypothetical protein
LTECDLNPDKTRQKTAEIFFESFNSPALFISPQTILALYAAGKTTGVVLDVGDGVSHAVSVYEGFALSNAIVRSDIAGRDVTENLWLQLRRAGYTFHTSVRIIRCSLFSSFIALSCARRNLILYAKLRKPLVIYYFNLKKIYPIHLGNLLMQVPIISFQMVQI